MNQKLSLFFIILLLLGSIVNASSSYAMSSNKVFVIKNISVDVTANTALVAREKALEKGQIIAWRRLLQRLTLMDAADSIAKVPFLEIRPLIRGYEVLRERTSPVRYVAELSVTFNDEDVRQFLLNNAVAFAETPSLPVLVIPVLIKQGVSALWENPNPWRDLWQNLPEQDGLVQIIVPKGNIFDIRDLSALQALRGVETRLKVIADRYQAQSVIIAKASKGFDVKDNLPVLEITVTKFNADMVEETIIDSIKGQADDDLLGLLDAGVTRVVTFISTTWKRKNLVNSSSMIRVAAVAPIYDFENWLSVQFRLNKIGVLKKIDLLRISKKEAFLDLWVMGNLAQLKNALLQKQLMLVDGRREFILSDRKQKIPEEYLPGLKK